MAKLQMSFDFANDSLQNSTSEVNEIASKSLNDNNIASCEIFSNERFGKIRVAGTGEDPLFCLVDVCAALNLRPGDVVRRLPDGVVSTHPIFDSMGRRQVANFINEDGLYDVIFDSRKPETRDFRRWVTRDVLPSIRKTGKYEVNPQPQLPGTYLEALKALVAAEEEKERLRLENESKQKTIEEQAPKVGYYDELVERGNNTNIRDTAGELGMRQNEFVQLMLAWGILYRDKKRQLKPTAEAKEKGLCVLKEYTSQTNGYTGNQTMFTVEGKNYIRRRRLKA